jgi:DNA mismatch repair protein MutS2
MLYPISFESKLGFGQIRELIASYCLSTLGRSQVDDMTFIPLADEVLKLLRLTGEMLEIISFEENYPAQDYFDLRQELARITTRGTYMEEETLSEFRLSLQTVKSLVDFIEERKEKYPGISVMAVETVTDPIAFSLPSAMVTSIDRILDERSRVRDNASPELSKIRKEKAYKLASVESRIHHDLKIARQSGWTPEDAEITIRNGRLVIPMLSAHKRKISGYVHDESATGQTVYIEPAAIFETNNEIRELEYSERREVIRILTAFTDSVRPDTGNLLSLYRFLGLMDFLRAKALFARETGGTLPKMAARAQSSSAKAGKTGFSWHQAVHPNLFLHFKGSGKKVVPLDIDLGGDERLLVISGPNAGGKSVCLKTVGLVQYMFQCGLLPPVREDSEFMVFERIFIDIGDEQSIDNDLSTYTSKLLNLKFFLENANKDTLLLIDEFGSGTDPSQGGAMAEACLEILSRSGAFGVITTHYSNLKLLAGRIQGIANGAMLYDTRKLKPLYRLKKGVPGSSFAFEIAAGIGFPEEALDKARKLTGHSQLNFERQIQDLETVKEEVDKKSTELMVADEFLAELIGKYEKLTSELEKSKKEILEKARLEALQLLKEANSTIERTVKEIKEAQAEKERTKTARTEIRDLREKLETVKFTNEAEETGKSHPPAPENKPSAKKEQGRKEKQAGPKSRLQLDEPLPARHRQYQSYIDDLQRKLYEFQLTLDIRGKRVDEAIAMLQKYIDDAILLSINEVRILHGKGNGVLRQVCRDYLRTVKDVKSLRFEAPESGGDGVTLVSFR